MKDKSKAEKIITPDGLDIYYWITSDKQHKGNFRVLHTSIGTNHSFLEPLEKGLNERGYPTIVFDPRGSGYSDAPTEPDYYSLEKYSGDLEEIIKKKGLEKPVLLGHSFGFMPIVEYTSRTSNAKQLIGICGSHNFSETGDIFPTNGCIKSLNKVQFYIFDKGLIKYLDQSASVIINIAHKLKREQRGEIPELSDQDKSDFQIWLSMNDVSFEQLRARRVSADLNIDISEQLGRIYKPTLLIYGKNDWTVRYVAGDYIKKIIKGPCQVEIIEEGTHTLPLKKTQETLKIIDKYKPTQHP